MNDTNNTTTSTDADDEALAKLKADPRYGTMKKLVRAELNEFVEESKAKRKASKKQATTPKVQDADDDDDDDGNIFDKIFGG